MQFARIPTRRRPENIVPMINVVFLLLIFFLMSAQIAPAPPFDITPPDAASDMTAEGGDSLYVAANGQLAFAEARDAQVWPALAAAGTTSLTVRADADLAASDLARLLPRIRAAGVAEIKLVVAAR